MSAVLREYLLLSFLWNEPRLNLKRLLLIPLTPIDVAFDLFTGTNVLEMRGVYLRLSRRGSTMFTHQALTLRPRSRSFAPDCWDNT